MAESPQSTSNTSAAQPGKAHLVLQMLNPASVKTGGTWDVHVRRAFEDKYEYTWQGKARQGTNFGCTLVSQEDSRQYCQAQFKKTSQKVAKYQQAVKAYKPDGRFVMPKVAFVEDAKAAYISCPLKMVVDLSKTKMDRLPELTNCLIRCLSVGCSKDITH